MGFDKFRRNSILRGKGILGVFSICIIVVSLFILIMSYRNTGVFNFSALAATAVGVICFYLAVTRKIK